MSWLQLRSSGTSSPGSNRVANFLSRRSVPSKYEKRNYSQLPVPVKRPTKLLNPRQRLKHFDKSERLVYDMSNPAVRNTLDTVFLFNYLATYRGSFFRILTKHCWGLLDHVSNRDYYSIKTPAIGIPRNEKTKPHKVEILFSKEPHCEVTSLSFVSPDESNV